MSFERMMNDRFMFLKASGEVVKNDVSGLYTGGKVMTFDTTLPVQPGDRFLRKLPNSLTEEFIVDDPGYFAGLRGGKNAHYNAKVHRADSPAQNAESTIHHITNNFHGSNARANINSIDNSVNIAFDTPTELLQKVRKAVEDGIQDQSEKAMILAKIDDMEAATDKPTFAQRYAAFVSAAANHITLIAPFLAALGAVGS